MTVRSTPYGEIADYYDPMLWSRLDPLLRERAVELLTDISSLNTPMHVAEQMRWRLAELKNVRDMANDLTRPKVDEE